MSDNLQQEIDLQSETIKQQAKEIATLKEELNALKSSTKKTLKHSPLFWQNVAANCYRRGGPYGTDTLKMMIKSGKMTVNDEDDKHESLLLNATNYGAYEFIQFLVNNGADLDATNKDGQTALDVSRDCTYPNIEKFLLFSKMNVSAGNEIQAIAEKIKKQNGINECVSNELAKIGANSKQLYEQTLMELMVRCMQKRLVFSDDFLVYAFEQAVKDEKGILSSKLWLQIRTTVSSIVQKGSYKDWFWLKECLLPSMIWYKDISTKDSDETHYLYFELLKLVNIEALNQINALEENINKMANKQQKDWNALIEWNIPDSHAPARQDMIVNGISSRYTFEQLSASSGTTFNSPNFYDHNQYLSQLVLLAQIVDDEFHQSIQGIFKIDKLSSKGQVSFDDEKSEVGIVEYMRGPVKLMERARAKAQNDYAHEPYPASACVIDFNRCALIFDDISSLLRGLKMFVNKVKYYQSGNIIAIARDKNGFIEYVKEAQYADIKLNVVIKGKHNSIIGEVQFLLRAMKEYKDKAHNLYAIQRKEETIKESASKTLPILFDRKKEILEIGCNGNVKQACDLMVFQNQSIDNLLFASEISGETVFHNICYFGHLKLLKFLQSMMPVDKFVDYLFLPAKDGQICIETSIVYVQPPIVKHLFGMEAVKKKYESDTALLFRLVWYLNGNIGNREIVQFVVTALGLTEARLQEVKSYRDIDITKLVEFL